ncbi:shikimate kinase [Bacillus thuringiensis]|uniref:Shikimate kinase n=6 Tax=Bacillus cereus group TaxID=86661 RepID=AROK_BACC2|nr:MULTISPECIES: shikimate kinase [Bacillus]B7IXM2.1 RecName: Full=Shikimate kinase; Short=SK [Bacillus cereus G9842]ACK94373.1 shikimate kinase [Bacillus cereus G9842]AFQ19042.1 shikimate kinase [Bacillus thuringiensis HD-771]EOP84705.1 shikimate kinase [Bacillus cereus HuB4-4]KAA6466402.1 shikimate kinase [Bacillus cereus]KAA6477447.1 shikimate kinase [Bacillus cereus]
MKSIYITGYMGAGKTTIGKALSQELQMDVVDTDQKIEEKQKKAIRDIFAEEGEMTFREYESEMLRSLPVHNVIITTGGGIIERAENRKWMKENGTVVYLYCDPNVIAERLREDTTRPLFQKKDIDAFVKKFESRRAYYEEAHIHIDTTNKSVKQIMNELKEKINV